MEKRETPPLFNAILRCRGKLSVNIDGKILSRRYVFGPTDIEEVVEIYIHLHFEAAYQQVPDAKDGLTRLPLEQDQTAVLKFFKIRKKNEKTIAAEP